MLAGRTGRAQAGTRLPLLANASIELTGSWGEMLQPSVLKVLHRTRSACLQQVELISDRQPQNLVVERRDNHPPAIWLQQKRAHTAWVVVDIGERDWSKLAYQFGHELGHVVCNSWSPDSKPRRPSQWLEEALVEAFSLRGLKRLAEDWRTRPPFRGDSAFAGTLEDYRADILAEYTGLGAKQGGLDDLPAWFDRNRKQLEQFPGLGDEARAAALKLLAMLDRDPSCISALGALNRWPERSSLPLNAYLRAWTRSCTELRASTALPEQLSLLLGPPRPWRKLEQ